MLIYEKENKLNINFENSVNETPDVQIGKDGDKTQILVDGQESGGGSGGALIVTMTEDQPGEGLSWLSETTFGEVYDAYVAGRPVWFKYVGNPINSGNTPNNMPDDSYTTVAGVYIKGGYVNIYVIDLAKLMINSNSDISCIHLEGSESAHVYVSYYD